MSSTSDKPFTDTQIIYFLIFQGIFTILTVFYFLQVQGRYFRKSKSTSHGSAYEKYILEKELIKEAEKKNESKK
ncbi:20802_t:CDS:1, partial [Racocetra persica]